MNTSQSLLGSAQSPAQSTAPSQPPAPNPFRSRYLPGVVPPNHAQEVDIADEDDVEIKIKIRIYGFYKCIAGSSYLVINIDNRHYFLHPSVKKYARLHAFSRERRYANAAEWYVMTNVCHVDIFVVFNNMRAPKFVQNEELKQAIGLNPSFPPMSRASNGYYTFPVADGLSPSTMARVSGFSEFYRNVNSDFANNVAPVPALAPAPVQVVASKRSSDDDNDNDIGADVDDREQKKMRVFLGICSICMDSEVTHIVVPCGHACLCGECQSRLNRRDGCPICRQRMTFITKIFSNNSE